MYNSLSHSKWDCNHHVVFIPKYRKQALFVDVRKHLGNIFHEPARQKECTIIEEHLVHRKPGAISESTSLNKFILSR